MKKVAIVFFLLALIACASTPRPTTEQITSADYGPFPSNAEELIKELFASKLIDPYSAVYTFKQSQRGWNNMSDELVFGWRVCGTINSKNRLGGYVGAKPFYAMIYNNKVIRFFCEAFSIPDSFKMGLISGMMSSAHYWDNLCKD